jgi:cobalt-zinc-cadmium efflux system outer membrane protein
MWPWAALLLYAVPGFGQERILTLDDALALAREQGAGVILARGRIEEARARQTQAGCRFQESPTVEVNAGYRRADAGFLDAEAAVTQGLDAGARRAARLAGTQAALDRAEAELAEARRLLLRDVGVTFVRALVAGERVSVLTHSRQGAEELLATTERRFEAGEATALDQNRSLAAAAQARAAQSAAEAERDAALAELKPLLGLSAGENLDIRGSLDPRPPLDLKTLLAGLDRRPDLQALAAELREAEAEIQRGQSLTRPDWGLRGAVAREERAKIVTAGVVVTLPVHHRGEEAIAAQIEA